MAGVAARAMPVAVEQRWLGGHAGAAAAGRAVLGGVGRRGSSSASMGLSPLPLLQAPGGDPLRVQVTSTGAPIPSPGAPVGRRQRASADPALGPADPADPASLHVEATPFEDAFIL